jgi:alpha-beta hydrolase superfamily lysophospholipase
MEAPSSVGIDFRNTGAEPLYIVSGGHGLFGWLHSLRDQRDPELGLVICNPFGYEAICSHRAIRTFAESAAAAGIPTLRFDCAGTGDATELDPLADQIDTWRENSITAIRELQRRTGVKSVCLLGFRLGALIAALAAKECRSSVVGLALISPIISGRRYLRELRTARLAAMLRVDCDQQNGEGEPETASPLPNGSIEAGGFSMSPATIARLSTLDLSTLSEAPQGDILVVDGDSLPVSRKWADSLIKAGGRVTYKVLPGLVQMLMTAPQFAKVPHEMIAATNEWLTSVRRATPGYSGNEAPAAAGAESIGAAETGAMHGQLLSLHDGVTERPVFFGRDGILFGIVTEPPRDEKRKRAVVLVNAGADYHVGANGMYVPFARRWAGQGYVVLRMDLSGIGDSGTRKGRSNEDVFPLAAIDDMRAAIELVQRSYGAADITLVGLCSGAYHALRGAAAGLPVSRILMINPQNYFWKEGMSINDMQVAELIHNPALYRAKAFSLDRWKRLLTGKVDLFYVFKVLQRRFLLHFGAALRELGRRLHIHLPNDLGWDLQRIASRGVQLAFIFARGEPGITLLRIQAGSAIEKMGSQCRIRIIDAGDHVFSRRQHRASLEGMLDEELYARNVCTESVTVARDWHRPQSAASGDKVRAGDTKPA